MKEPPESATWDAAYSSLFRPALVRGLPGVYTGDFHEITPPFQLFKNELACLDGVIQNWGDFYLLFFKICYLSRVKSWIGGPIGDIRFGIVLERFSN
jgi:hypothetical protein